MRHWIYRTFILPKQRRIHSVTHLDGSGSTIDTSEVNGWGYLFHSILYGLRRGG